MKWKPFHHQTAFPLYNPGYSEDQRGTCMTASRYLAIRMPKSLAPQDTVNALSLRDSYVSVTNPTSNVYLPEPAKTVEEGWPAGIKNPK